MESIEGAESAGSGKDRGRRVLDLAGRLSFPRYPGTEGDRRAIEMVRQALSGTGLEVVEEAFSYDLRHAWWALRTVLSTSGILVTSSGWLLADRPRLATVLFVGALLPPGVFLTWAPWLERLYRREGATQTANVVARRPAEEPRMSLVLMAHHDSKSQSLTLPWRLGLTLGAIGCSLLLALQVILSWAGQGDALPVWSAAAAGTLGGACLLVLATLHNGNRSPGAVDNAGSVGLLVELARSLPAIVPDDVELIFLSPGAEEDHMVGAMRWLDRHRPEEWRQPVFVLNFDGGGNPGRVALLERYGFGRRFSKRLSESTRRAARRLGVAVRGVLLPPGMGIDAIPFAHRGVDSITFSSGSLGPATLAVHSAGDRKEHLDGATLATIADLAEELVRELVSESAR